MLKKLRNHYGKTRWHPLGNNLVFANAQTEKIQIFLGQGRWVSTLQEVDQNKYSSTKKTRKSLQRLPNIENQLAIISQPKKFTICLQLIACRRARCILRRDTLSRKEEKPTGL